jgi:phage anti-repressor protein
MTQPNFTENTALLLLDSHEPFPVDFDRAWKWLGFSRKNNAKQSLLDCGFIEGIDLLINQHLEEPTVTGWVNPKPKEEIWLTIDCFKTWGMMANTEQGKQVRKYFLQCEKVAKQKAAELLDRDRKLYDELNSIKQTLADIKQGQVALPAVPEMTRAAQVKELVGNYVDRIGAEYGKTWTMLYRKFGLLHNWHPNPKSKKTKLAQIEEAGLIEELYQLALKLFI